jgi:signal transduction histidine kinase
VLLLVEQESLTNIHRHSGSKIARIRLVMECAGHRKNAVLTIEDAGKGFPRTPGLSRLVGPKHAGGFGQGVGLASMRERLHQIDGVLEIESQTGQTIVRAVVPLLDRERSLRAGE